jgi:hypothetical protein
MFVTRGGRVTDVADGSVLSFDPRPDGSTEFPSWPPLN